MTFGNTGGVFATISAAGNAALGIQDILSNPISAPMEILGMLTGPEFELRTTLSLCQDGSIKAIIDQG
jgi:hypothetical protein